MYCHFAWLARSTATPARCGALPMAVTAKLSCVFCDSATSSLRLLAGTEVAVGAGAVFNNDGLLERFGQRLADGAADDVRRAARWVRHDQADRFGRPGL